MLRLSGVGSRGQQFQQKAPDFPLLSNISGMLLGDPEAFPGQCGDVIRPSGPWSALIQYICYFLSQKKSKHDRDAFPILMG